MILEALVEWQVVRRVVSDSKISTGVSKISNDSEMFATLN